MASKRPRVLGFFLATIGLLGSALGMPVMAAPGVPDEAQQAGRDAASFPPADEDYFQAMDNGLALTAGRGQGPQHVAGLDRRQRPVLGPADPRHLRRLRSPEDDLLASRAEEPPRQPLALSRPDQRALLRRGRRGPIRSASGCGSTSAAPTARPTRSPTQQKYPGVAIGARGKNLPVGSYYGEPTGVLGLRLFPNPAFDEAAAKKWDAERFYSDPDYYNRQGPGAALPGRHVLRLLPCRARARSPRRTTPRTRNGRTSTRRWARSISGSTGSSPGRPTRPTTCTSWSTPSGRARSTPRWCRPTTSTTRAR